MDEITSLIELDKVERHIAKVLAAIPRDGMIRAIEMALATKTVKTFQAAGMISFAMRYCAPSARRESAPPDKSTIAKLAHWVMLFLLADPCAFGDADVPTDLVSMMLRVVGNQFPYDVPIAMLQSRAVVLYHDLPTTLSHRKNVPSFNFPRAFETVHGVGVKEYLCVGFTLYAATHGDNNITRDYCVFRRKVRIDSARRCAPIPRDGVH